MAINGVNLTYILINEDRYDVTRCLFKNMREEVGKEK